MWTRSWRTFGVVFVFAAACSSSPSLPPSPSISETTPPTATPARTERVEPQPSRVAVIVMENKEYEAVIGSRDAPYINSLARRHALATNFFAVTHPSLPNYIAMLGGDLHGITTNCTECHTNARNLVDELEEAGISWGAYMDAMPRPCFTGPFSGRYAKKHNPFMYFDSITNDPARCNKVIPLSDLDERALPTFTFVTPDLCNDMHDCSVAVGDRFLSHLVPRILRGLGPRGVLFLTFDEGSSGRGGGGHIVTIAAGPGAKPGRYGQRWDHYSLLRTISERLGVEAVDKARTAASMSAMLR